MDKKAVADILTEIGVLLDLKGENAFKSRAYANAARAIDTLAEPIEKVVAEGRLGSVKGIGESLQQKVQELVTTGKLAYYDELKASLPPGLLEMLQIPSLGPKKVKALYEKLGITTIEALEAACKSGKVAELSGFGEKTAAKICEGINFRRTYAAKHLLVEGLAVATPILQALQQHPDVIRCSTAGSSRRFKETIGDIDFVVSSNNPAPIIEFFVGMPGIVTVLAKGETKASVILPGGIQGDLRVVSDSEYPFTLNYFTGSKEHNIVMRQRAIQRGLRLNEYGLFRSDEETRDPNLLVPCADEAAIYKQLGLAFVPPEMREDCGEFAAAEKNQLPQLVQASDIKGSLHNHSDWSDGRDSLMGIVNFMRAHGMQYWAITDHSKASFQANGLQPDRVRKQILEVKEINQRLADEGVDFRLLTGIEVDILKAGLDFDDDLLAQLDVVVASLHAGSSQDETENTEHLIKAAQNRHVHMLGHLTGRLLLQREAYKINQQAVIDACAATGTWLELNAQPTRLDLDWRQWQYAKSKGVKCAINCDAHSLEEQGYLWLGSGLARKGWLTPADVVNTLPLHDLLQELALKRK